MPIPSTKRKSTNGAVKIDSSELYDISIIVFSVITRKESEMKFVSFFCLNDLRRRSLKACLFLFMHPAMQLTAIFEGTRGLAQEFTSLSSFFAPSFSSYNYGTAGAGSSAICSILNTWILTRHNTVKK